MAAAGFQIRTAQIQSGDEASRIDTTGRSPSWIGRAGLLTLAQPGGFRGASCRRRATHRRKHVPASAGSYGSGQHLQDLIEIVLGDCFLACLRGAG
jgi:hypothetical protein